MAVRIYWLHQFNNLARLGIMARPRGEDWLEDEIVNLKQQDVQVMVSLLEQEEIAALGLGKQADLCSKHNIEYINFPIVDRGTPGQNKNLCSFIDRLEGCIDAGNKIVLRVPDTEEQIAWLKKQEKEQ